MHPELPEKKKCLAAVLVMALAFQNGEISILDAVILLSCYIIYVIVYIVSPWVRAWSFERAGERQPRGRTLVLKRGLRLSLVQRYNQLQNGTPLPMIDDILLSPTMFPIFASTALRQILR